MPSPASTAEEYSYIDLVGPYKTQAGFLSVLSRNAMSAAKPSHLLTVYDIGMVARSGPRSLIEYVRYFVQDYNSELVGACKGVENRRDLGNVFRSFYQS